MPGPIPRARGTDGWEELPYWLKGYGDLGYVLKDEAIIKMARRWIEAALASQREDGWFGPRSLLTSLDGKPDLWPNMLMLNVLQSYYEYTGDPRVLPFMTKYFRWELAYPEKDFLVGYWPKIRGGDNLESVYWLYNRTGEKWLLDLAEKDPSPHRGLDRRRRQLARREHRPRLSRAGRLLSAGQGSQVSRRCRAELSDAVMGLYGQVPGGGFGADENCRPGYGDPRQGFETCSIVEFMHSFEMLTKISGDPRWSDRCEDVAFNSLPAAMTPDLKALHYLTAPNMVQLDKENKAPGIQNGGTMISYSPLEVYRCCQHNVSHGWPYFAEELWLASADGGLCASIYAASDVTAKVAGGAEVKIRRADRLSLCRHDSIHGLGGQAGPLSALSARAAAGATSRLCEINGQAAGMARRAALVSGDRPHLGRRRRGEPALADASRACASGRKTTNSVSVIYGPLTFSLAIGERWQRYGGTDAWPEEEVFPTTPWNYGLVLDARSAGQIVRGGTAAQGPLAKQPFTPETSPIRIKAQARQNPRLEARWHGLVGPLQPSPVESKEPVETITLIPMGAARLRIAAFPTIGDGPEAHIWTAPPKLPLASHCFENDTTARPERRHPAQQIRATSPSRDSPGGTTAARANGWNTISTSRAS